MKIKMGKNHELSHNTEDFWSKRIQSWTYFVVSRVNSNFNDNVIVNLGQMNGNMDYKDQ